MQYKWNEGIQEQYLSKKIQRKQAPGKREHEIYQIQMKLLKHHFFLHSMKTNHISQKTQLARGTHTSISPSISQMHPFSPVMRHVHFHENSITQNQNPNKGSIEIPCGVPSLEEGHQLPPNSKPKARSLSPARVGDTRPKQSRIPSSSRTSEPPKDQEVHPNRLLRSFHELPMF